MLAELARSNSPVRPSSRSPSTSAGYATAAPPSCPGSVRKSSVAGGEFHDGTPANDALLVQLVRGTPGRGTLGRGPRSRGEPRINVSSCSFVVTLHGLA